MWQSIQQMERDRERKKEPGKNQARSGVLESVCGGEGFGGVMSGQVVLRAQQN